MRTTLHATILIGFAVVGMASPIFPAVNLARADDHQDEVKAGMVLTAAEMDRAVAGAIPLRYPVIGLARAQQKTQERSPVTFGDGLTGRRPASAAHRSLPAFSLISAGMKSGPLEHPAVARHLIGHEVSHALQRISRY